MEKIIALSENTKAIAIPIRFKVPAMKWWLRSSGSCPMRRRNHRTWDVSPWPLLIKQGIKQFHPTRTIFNPWNSHVTSSLTERILYRYPFYVLSAFLPSFSELVSMSLKHSLLYFLAICTLGTGLPVSPTSSSAIETGQGTFFFPGYCIQRSIVLIWA